MWEAHTTNITICNHLWHTCLSADRVEAPLLDEQLAHFGSSVVELLGAVRCLAKEDPACVRWNMIKNGPGRELVGVLLGKAHESLGLGHLAGSRRILSRRRRRSAVHDSVYILHRYKVSRTAAPVMGMPVPALSKHKPDVGQPNLGRQAKSACQVRVHV